MNRLEWKFGPCRERGQHWKFGTSQPIKSHLVDVPVMHGVCCCYHDSLTVLCLTRIDRRIPKFQCCLSSRHDFLSSLPVISNRSRFLELTTSSISSRHLLLFWLLTLRFLMMSTFFGWSWQARPLSHFSSKYESSARECLVLVYSSSTEERGSVSCSYEPQQLLLAAILELVLLCFTLYRHENSGDHKFAYY